MIVESVTGIDLHVYGIYPREPAGLLGILTAPFIHDSPRHLLANTAPIVILGTALLYGYPKSSRIVLPVLFLGTGLSVWLSGHPSYHVGAGGIATGVIVFVFASGVLRWDRRAIGLGMVAFLPYGVIWGRVPGDPPISVETHLSGAVLGLVLVLLLRKLDPPPPKYYSWELKPRVDPRRDREDA